MIPRTPCLLPAAPLLRRSAARSEGFWFGFSWILPRTLKNSLLILCRNSVLYIHIYRVYINIYVHLYMSAYVYVYIYRERHDVCVYIYIYVCIHTYVYIYIYIHMFIYIYICVKVIFAPSCTLRPVGLPWALSLSCPRFPVSLPKGAWALK